MGKRRLKWLQLFRKVRVVEVMVWNRVFRFSQGAFNTYRMTSRTRAFDVSVWYTDYEGWFYAGWCSFVGKWERWPLHDWRRVLNRV